MMETQKLFRRLVVPSMVGMLIFAVGACDGSTDVEDEPEVETIRLTVGTQTINLVSGNPTAFTIPRTANALSAVFLKANGQVETLVTNNPTEFELQVTPANATIVTFTRIGPFTGTLTGLAAGSTTLHICLFHKGENHCEPGADVTANPITVQ